MPEPAKGGAMIRLTFDTQWFHASFQPPDCRTYSTEVTCKKQQSPVSSHTTPIQALGYHITKIPWCQGDFSIFFNFFEMRFLPQLDTSGFGSDWAGPRCFFRLRRKLCCIRRGSMPRRRWFLRFGRLLSKMQVDIAVVDRRCEGFLPAALLFGQVACTFFD